MVKKNFENMGRMKQLRKHGSAYLKKSPVHFCSVVFEISQIIFPKKYRIKIFENMKTIKQIKKQRSDDNKNSP
jgi:hypothetical protein